MPLDGLNVLSKEKSSRQVKLVVSAPEPESLWKLRDHPTVAEIDVHVPSLEEIFITFIRSPDKESLGDDAKQRSAQTKQAD